MDWQSTQKIKDPKSVIFDQVAVVKPILGELLFIESLTVIKILEKFLKKVKFITLRIFL